MDNLPEDRAERDEFGLLKPEPEPIAWEALMWAIIFCMIVFGLFLPLSGYEPRF